jgi:hypothetical protein
MRIRLEAEQAQDHDIVAIVILETRHLNVLEKKDRESGKGKVLQL